MARKHITTHYHDLIDQRRRTHRNDRLSMLGVIVVLPTILAAVLHLCW